MSLTVNGKSGAVYTFDGPYSDTDDLKDESGVYVVVCNKSGSYDPLDVGEAAKVKNRIETHTRKKCWSDNCKESIECAVYYIVYGKKPSRMEVEQDIRKNDDYNFPCGEQ